MPSASPHDDRGRSLPLLGLMAVVSGVGLVAGMDWLRSWSRFWSGSRQFALWGISACLILWGLKQCLTALRPDWMGTRFSRWNRHRMAATREGLVYIAIMSVLFVGSVLGRSNMLMLVFAMMIGPWVLNGWIAFSMLKRLHVHRRLPARTMAGELIAVELEIENRKWLLSSWLVAAHDSARHARDRFQAAALFVRVPGGQSRKGQYLVRFSQRGSYAFGPIELTTHFPLGLVERGLVCDEAAELIVHPRVGRLTSRWRRDLWHATELAQRRASRAGLFDDEFHRVREYRSGDNPKAIHWRTTARHNALMVREFHQSRDCDLVVLVELWRPEHPTTSDLDRIEWAISFAATVIQDQWSQSRDARWTLTICGQRTQQWHNTSNGDTWRDGLALATASPHAEVGAAFATARAQRGQGSRLVLISSRPRQDVRDRWPTVGDATDALCLSADPRELAPYFILEAGT